MITVYPHTELGTTKLPWLNAKHHFSFAYYYRPERIGFGALRVINDDVIEAGRGFESHPHSNMEIITYVREGAITHRDSQGNAGRTEAGDVQVMTAGSGVFHSEYNLEDQQTKLFQIWITPNQLNVTPHWQTHVFPKRDDESTLSLLVSGDGRAPLTIQQDARLYAGNLIANTTLEHTIEGQAYLLVAKGQLEMDGLALSDGDGAEITQQQKITLSSVNGAELLIIEVPAEPTL